MLEVPRLDDLDYKKLFERARAAIPGMTGDWTDFNDHDPGITMLQTFAWLCDNLNYYINATGEAHRLKYFKLLGIEPRMTPAKSRVALISPDAAPIVLTRGMRMAAGSVVFEVEKSLFQKGNRLVGLFARSGGTLTDLTAFAGVDGSVAPVFSGALRPEDAVYFGFSQPMQGEIRLYIEVAENGRNLLEDGFSLVDLRWECAGEDGRWHSAERLKDETGGLLRSGFITLRLPCAAVPAALDSLPEGSYLRCVPAAGSYDLAPRIGRVMVNCAEVVQTETWAQAVFEDYDGTGKLDIDYAVLGGDRVTVAVREPDGLLGVWYDSFDPDEARCAMESGGGPWRHRVRFDADAFGSAPESGARVMVNIIRPEAQRAVYLGETDGCARQRIPFEIDNICELSLALLETANDGAQRLRVLEQVDDLAMAGCDDWVFCYDAREGCVVFGDSLHGVQPPAGLRVQAVTVKTSRLGGGNVLAGQINRLLDDPGVSMTCFNPENAAGGERMLSSEEMEPVLEQRIRRVGRAVTEEDIRALVKATPGLIIDSVAVITAEEYTAATGAPPAPNTIFVAVKPGGDAALPALSEAYRKTIRNHLERYRLLTTDLQVIAARYVGVSVYGRIALAENNPRTQQQVLDALARIINGVDRGLFGQRIDLGRLFSSIEMLPPVRAVIGLSLEAIGAGGRKNEHGDVEIHPDSLAYLWETGIEFV